MTALGFVKLNVSDLETMAGFFASAFGAKEVSRLTIAGVDEILMTLAGNAPEIVLVKPHAQVEQVAGTMYGPVGIVVASCDAAAAACASAGGSVSMEPHTLEDAGIRVAFTATPEGHDLELVEMLGGEAA